ncbi:MAG: hypothetical protein RLY86_1003 [Pseudomonadota bacterium]|jgi:SSS family solute:Na+ symporter
MELQMTQVWVCILVTAIIGALTFWKCRQPTVIHSKDGNKEYFLAGGGLSWIFIAGSITLTNLSTDQLVGMNGNQMALLALWELAAVVGLLILTFVFLPIYYRYNCTTTTELLEKRYDNKHIRATVAVLFLLGNILIYLPIMLYSGSLFLRSMFGLDVPILVLAAILGVIGGAYAIFGGLRAVAVSDTYSGVLVLGLSLLVVYLALSAIDFDLSGIPAERLTLIGDDQSPIPWHTLLTGMLFIQIFYWSTNQTITQRAMAAPNLREAQKGVLTAVGIRLLIVPAIVVIPGIVSYKLYGDIGDAAYGRIVADLLPPWLAGVFAASIVAAVLTSYNSVLNASAALYVCDIHEKYIGTSINVPKFSAWFSLGLVVLSLALVPIYSGAESIINLVQQLNGLLSMPILSVFIVGLMFRNVDARAAIAGLVFGVGLYAVFTFAWTPLHYIHLMFITLWLTVGFALALNRLVFGRAAVPVWVKRPATA